ncbi:hypothetical protein Ancab_018126 [Ancistrocladus abbreviatus]
MELCDLTAQNPTQFAQKLAWICSRCPPRVSVFSGSPKVPHSQLNAILAIARFLSKFSNSTDPCPQTVVLDFLRAISGSFNRSFWPKSFNTDAISSFYSDFFGYILKATEFSGDFAEEVVSFLGETVISALSNGTGDNSSISRDFLSA